MKSDNRLTQLKDVFNEFYKKPRTMKEVSKITGILRENICWYCKELREQNKLFFVKKRKCIVTNNLVNEYSANDDFRPIESQLQLFD